MLFLGMLSLFGSCESDDTNNGNPTQIEGTYSGVFTVEYINGGSFSNPVTVTFGNGRYTSSAAADRFPAGGTGTFELEQDNISFADENIWTADFDWNLVLNGKYEYSLTGHQLHFSAQKNDVGVYEYILTKD